MIARIFEDGFFFAYGLTLILGGAVFIGTLALVEWLTKLIRSRWGNPWQR